jgi:hypothetical protein
MDTFHTHTLANPMQLVTTKAKRHLIGARCRWPPPRTASATASMCAAAPAKGGELSDLGRHLLVCLFEHPNEVSGDTYNKRRKYNEFFSPHIWVSQATMLDAPNEAQLASIEEGEKSLEE